MRGRRGAVMAKAATRGMLNAGNRIVSAPGTIRKASPAQRVGVLCGKRSAWCAVGVGSGVWCGGGEQVVKVHQYNVTGNQAFNQATRA